MNNATLFASLARLTAQTWQPYYDKPTAVNGFVVTFKAPFYADVSGISVTDYDCERCGDHGENGCQHLDAMMEAYQRIRHDTMHPAIADGMDAMDDYYDEMEQRMAGERGLL